MPVDPTYKVWVSDANGNSSLDTFPALSELAQIGQFNPNPHTHAPADITGTAVVDADARLTNDRKPAFSTGDGGTVTQTGNKTNSVTINKRCGQITMNGAALAAGAEVTFTVTNNTVASTDVVVACVQSVGTAGAYLVTVGAVSNGSFAITVSNASAGSLSQALVLNFVVIKGANS